MEIIMALIVLIIVFSIGFLVGNKQLLKKEANGIIGKKPKTQTDYQKEHSQSDPDFMYNWIREKSGKK